MNKKYSPTILSIALSLALLASCASMGTFEPRASYPRDDLVYLGFPLDRLSVETSVGDWPELPEDLTRLDQYSGDFSDIDEFVLIQVGAPGDSAEAFTALSIDDPSALIAALIADYDQTDGPVTLQLSFSPPLLAHREDGTWFEVLTPAEHAGRWPAEAVVDALDGARTTLVATGTIAQRSTTGG